MTEPVQPIIVASANGRIGFPAAIEILRAGGSATDAVIAATREVEATPTDRSVGYAGLPNILGDVELDASIMEGKGLRAGAVGGLQGYQDAIDLARAVMDRLPHSLVIGAGSRRLAEELGYVGKDLLDPETARIWREGLAAEGLDDASGASLDRVLQMVMKLSADPVRTHALYRPDERPDEPPHGTVNFMARDATGTMACAVSTSGWAWKYPGRLGDSPIIGAGNYCDDRWGAAACTGRGEMAFRCATAHSVVMFLRFGYSIEDAVTQALRDLESLDDPYAGEVNIVALTSDGQHFAGSTTPDRTYVWQTPDMAEPDEGARKHVPVSIVPGSV
ncbi:MAG TPA: isoaspartyl peptidase/L-asparaginase [Thermomicrobiales bacterium]|jgi:beta-aspartyl-peptidase (threonine type)|nr:isoaspartyl peptidase/L-asparaginase [Thermomicrobiales bacterium]